MEKDLNGVIAVGSFVIGMISLKYLLNRRPLLQGSFSRLITSSSSSSSSSVPSNITYSEEEASNYLSVLKLHQRKVKKPTAAQEVRNLIEYSNGYGVLSTNSSLNEGFPYGSVVGFQINQLGYPFFVFSKLSSHTKDVVKDGRVSLVVMSKDFKGASEGRVTLVGELEKVIDEESLQSLRDLYLQRHADAFWIDFGDFSYFRMKSIVSIRYVGGFARAATVSVEEYLAASPDALANKVTDEILHNLNQRYANQFAHYITKVMGVPCESGKLTGVDCCGVTISAKFPFLDPEESEMMVRLAFKTPMVDISSLDHLLELLEQ